jgi:hypothetical protein
METRMNELENAALAQALTNADGSVRSPVCCGVKMQDDGGCSEGCCDDFKCTLCGDRLRISWPD